VEILGIQFQNIKVNEISHSPLVFLGIFPAAKRVIAVKTLIWKLYKGEKSSMKTSVLRNLIENPHEYGYFEQL